MTDDEQDAEDIKQEMLVLDEEVNSIRTQIDLAKARRFNEGVYADPDWWARAHSALRHKGRQRQELQNQLAILNRRRKEENAVRDQSDERTFIQAAKALLTGEMYDAIWAKVKQANAQPCPHTHGGQHER